MKRCQNRRYAAEAIVIPHNAKVSSAGTVVETGHAVVQRSHSGATKASEAGLLLVQPLLEVQYLSLSEHRDSSRRVAPAYVVQGSQDCQPCFRLEHQHWKL
jgi:hypothetical protein